MTNYNSINLLSYKQKSPSSSVDVLIGENRDMEMESGSLSETTFTKSFPDVMNQKKKLQREEEKQNQPKK